MGGMLLLVWIDFTVWSVISCHGGVVRECLTPECGGGGGVGWGGGGGGPNPGRVVSVS